MKNFFFGWSTAAIIFFILGLMITVVFLILYRLFDWHFFYNISVAGAGISAEAYLCRKLPNFLFYLPLLIFTTLFSIALITSTGPLGLILIIPISISLISTLFILKYFAKKFL